ncbi:PadR family transcriptional regulator [Salipaludibacillus agaradhaerens]|jgi:DNA-binding PadR family transcriptional regulator|uniref:PadR family transcriptional regulator n=1 Tax=Salipaludibacillus agaradhaerens TaxID=76935 RepID=UPI000996A05C|nr:helix-turn-helix transcriptional regulator [Salipaludibacillus agaradhaerens]
MDKEIMKGSIDILILSVIGKGFTYGYEITKKLKEQSDDLYQMSEGTLYPALKRLENKGFLESYWGESVVAARRKHYKLTDKGKQELAKKTMEWNQVNKLVQSCTEGLT